MADGKSKSEELAQERTDYAENRTDWAEDRTIQATERTFAGWMRTAFAALGIGLGFRAVFGEFDPPWLAQAIATGFVLTGAVVSFMAQRRACASMERLHSHSIHAPDTRYVRWLSYFVTASALVLAAALWFLHRPSA